MEQTGYLAIRVSHIRARFQIQLVERNRRHPRLWQMLAKVNGRAKFLHRRQVRQVGRVIHQMKQRDEGMRLAAAVGEIQLPHRLVALARQPPHHVPRQVAQVVGWVGEREEFLRVFVNRALAFFQDDLIQIGGEHRQRQLARFQFITKLDHFVPRFPFWCWRHNYSCRVSMLNLGFHVQS